MNKEVASDSGLAMVPIPTDNPYLAEMFRHPLFGHLVETCAAVSGASTWSPDEKLIAAVKTSLAQNRKKDMIPKALVILTTHCLRFVPVDPSKDEAPETLILSENEHWNLSTQILVNGRALTVINGPPQTVNAPDPSKWQSLGMTDDAGDSGGFGQLFRLAQESVKWGRG